MPAYLGIGEDAHAALWDSATRHQNVSDELLYDLRDIIRLVGERYRRLRKLADASDEMNVLFAPEELADLARDLRSLLANELAERKDTTSSIRRELDDLLGLVGQASQKHFCMIAHVEYHLSPNAVAERKR
jgi:hypothetical protein